MASVNEEIACGLPQDNQGRKNLLTVAGDRSFGLLLPYGRQGRRFSPSNIRSTALWSLWAS